MTRSLPLLGALLCAALASSVSRAQPCVPGESPATCVDVTTLRYCESSGQLATFDCSLQTDAACGDSWTCVNQAANAACAPIDACVSVSPGASCTVALWQPTPGYWGCEEPFACILGDDTGLQERCADLGDTCGPGEQHKGCVAGTIATRCTASVFGAGMWFTSPFGTDCSAFGATCIDSGAAPYCEVLEGGACLDPGHLLGDTLRCAPGLVCQGSDYGTLGSCVPEEPSDGGSGDGGNDDGGSDDGGAPLADAGAPTDAGAPVPDAGPIVDAGGPTSDGGALRRDAGSVFDDECGEVTAAGTCEGDLLRFCQAGRVAERDCAVDALVCAERASLGADCVSASDLDDGADAGAFSLYCRCTLASGGSGAWLALLALVLVRRRRPRARA